MTEQLAAMRQALEFIEANTYGGSDVDTLAIKLRTAIEQAETAQGQEPVAKVVRNTVGQISIQTPDGNAFDVSKHVGAVFYTTPPAAQRQWVGLTQQDIDIAFDDTQEGGGFNEFARAIEQRLKEKNT